MSMSNSQLYRKLKAQTGLSAHELIQGIRLAKVPNLFSKEPGIPSLRSPTIVALVIPNIFPGYLRKKWVALPLNFEIHNQRKVAPTF
jgi:hypothetical protein